MCLLVHGEDSEGVGATGGKDSEAEHGLIGRTLRWMSSGSWSRGTGFAEGCCRSCMEPIHVSYFPWKPCLTLSTLLEL